MTPSDFLEVQTHYLRDAGLGYSFLRNAEGYPETITGDVDILVEQASLSKLRSYYEQLDNDAVRVVQMIRKPHDLYVLLYFPENSDRKFLVIEYFSGLIYRNRVILSSDWLIENSTAEDIWRRLPEDISITYTYVHYLIYKGYLPEKYRPLLDRYGLHQELIGKISEVLRARHPGIAVADPLGEPKLLRRQLRGLVSKVDVLGGYLAQAAKIRENSLGARVFAHPDDVTKLLEFAELYHLFRPTHRYGFKSYGVAERLKAFLVVLIGGLAVVADRNVPAADNVSKYVEQVAEKR